MFHAILGTQSWLKSNLQTSLQGDMISITMANHQHTAKLTAASFRLSWFSDICFLIWSSWSWMTCCCRSIAAFFIANSLNCSVYDSLSLIADFKQDPWFSKVIKSVQSKSFTSLSSRELARPTDTSSPASIWNSRAARWRFASRKWLWRACSCCYKAWHTSMKFWKNNQSERITRTSMKPISLLRLACRALSSSMRRNRVVWCSSASVFRFFHSLEARPSSGQYKAWAREEKGHLISVAESPPVTKRFMAPRSL